MQIYQDYNFKVGLAQVFDIDTSNNLFNYFDTTLDWHNQSSSRRQKFLFGNDGITYTVNYHGKQTNYQVLPWLPILLELRDLLQIITGDIYTVCSIQRYPHGGVGIDPHRDKEMKLGTTILGLSLGAQRNLVLSKNDKVLTLSLPPGSVYILYPPTNSYWLHSIPKDGTLTTRISLTFRNY